MTPADPNAPIFVVGYMHSGTTLLHNMLAAHPDVFAAADETRYFGYLPFLKTLYPDLRDRDTRGALVLMLADQIENGDPARMRTMPPRYCPLVAALNEAELTAVHDQLGDAPDYGDVFRAVFDTLAQRANKTRWLEKTPQHVYLISEILQAVPNALFVEIIRDPRDILASKKKRRQVIRRNTDLTPEQRRVARLERVYEPFWEALEWRLALVAGQRAAQDHAGRVMSLRYEDLVRNPEAVTRSVCDFVGLDYSPDLLNVSLSNTAEGRREAQRGVVADAVERWRRTLNAGEVALCQRVTGSQLARAGYQPAAVPLWGWLLLPWLLLRAGIGLIDRLIRRWRLGGFEFLMNTLKNYVKELRKLAARR